MRMVRLASIAISGLTSLSLVACGGGGSGDDDGDDDTAPDADVTVPPDADNSDFTTLISREWTIPPGETYKCIGVQADQDYYINAFRPLGPNGTHHTVLSISDTPGGPANRTQAGEYDCNASALALEMLFASGVGTDDLQLPGGVALKIEQGQWIHLNLHLFNTNPSEDLTATSGILVKTLAPEDVENEAEMVFAGNMNFTIPPGEQTITGGCTFSQASTLFAYWPHMHQYATHQKVTLTLGGNEMVLHDEPFGFEEQVNFPVSPMIQVADGDRIDVECTYNNTSGGDIEFGDSSTTEMCFTGLYRYPKYSFLFGCATGLD